jgi:hypothetical protein
MRGGLDLGLRSGTSAREDPLCLTLQSRSSSSTMTSAQSPAETRSDQCFSDPVTRLAIVGRVSTHPCADDFSRRS